MKSSSSTVLVFASGELVLLGMKSSKSLNKLVRHIVGTIKNINSSAYHPSSSPQPQ